jgi:hypothetical protein
MKRPNLFIIGAPKCGTTSLADWLRQHPEIFLPGGLIEPNFFNSDHVDAFRPTLAEYESRFAPAEDRHRYVGEKSVWYLSSDAAVPNILQYSPNARLIVCVRDPIEMAFALHHHQLFDGIERLSNFREAWDAQGERSRNVTGPARASAYLLYGWTCKLGAQLERLMARVSAERIHVVFMDDIRRTPEAVYSSIVDFLEVAPFTPEFRIVNEAKANRFAIVKHLAVRVGAAKRALGIKHPFGILERIGSWNRRPQNWQPDAQMTGVLRSYFQEDVALLGRLTRRDLSHWLR